ncbi:hypothetical protein SASPL_104443 [Salvia splendens]|uniref:Uncharacterized protein n=1 Tax=Salvia splendens TaxID=180675 RepID=A0A8X8YH77_SALSN|nr:uncharacterized protein LOC121770891 [Salvia splendens]KAG6432855.1 hypothetical protein SASPL_104443 [Salvia splendens]
MGEMASLWSYAEHGEMDELGQKLLYTSLELEKLKSEAMEEMQKNKEYVNQLIQLLKCAIEERDEARRQLDKLTSAAAISSPYFQGGGDTSLLKPAAKANSSITESNSFTDTQNYHSPADSIFDAAAVSSPAIVQDPVVDRASVIIDNLSRGRVLPRKGMLLQAVLQAEPLLQTLMVAGPLPRWRNPPQMQPFQIPPVSIKRQQVMSGSIVSKFGDFNHGTNASLIPSAAVSSSGGGGCFQLPKRQRFC